MVKRLRFLYLLHSVCSLKQSAAVHKVVASLNNIFTNCTRDIMLLFFLKKNCTFHVRFLLFCSQLFANTVLFTSVNLSGLFVRILTERAQRKAFLQARDCIEERLRMEDENEKQVQASGNG